MVLIQVVPKWSLFPSRFCCNLGPTQPTCRWHGLRPSQDMALWDTYSGHVGHGLTCKRPALISDTTQAIYSAAAVTTKTSMVTLSQTEQCTSPQRNIPKNHSKCSFPVFSDPLCVDIPSQFIGNHVPRQTICIYGFAHWWCTFESGPWPIRTI